MSPLPAFVTTKARLQPQMSLYPLSHTLDELQHFSGRDIPRARVSGSVVDLLVRTGWGESLGNQPQGCQLGNGRRGDGSV